MDNKQLQILKKQLEKLTDKKVKLVEADITRQHKKKFYGVTADFEREANRLVNFYEVNVAEHYDMKPLLRRLKRLLSNIEDVFSQTELYLDGETNKEVISAPIEIESVIPNLEENEIDELSEKTSVKNIKKQ
jgi:hypothetical protein